jgi:acyl-[acyl-carrier-protein]-phospholipid O-acyltransferase/long-chain-fatty-acid--[acyl-carrier-protein] ligase
MRSKLLKSILRGFFRCVYRVKIIGLENYPKNSSRLLILANHVSFLDGLLLSIFLPENVSFVVHSYYSKRSWVNFFFSFTNVFVVDQNNPFIIKTLIKEIKNGVHCVIFPEGKISTTGTLMKMYDGPGLIADKADADVLPIRIDGPQYTPFTRFANRSEKKLFPRCTIYILPPQKIHCDKTITGRKRRQLLTLKVTDLMSDLIFKTSPYQTTLFLSLLDAAKKFGGSKSIIEDLERKPLSYKQFILRSYVLGKYIADHSTHQEFIGILLPTCNAAAVCIFASYAFGRVPAILNFTMTPEVILDSCLRSNIKQIYTSKQFIEKGKFELIIELLRPHINIIFLEDLKQEISLIDKLLGKIHATFPYYFYKKFNPTISPQDPAVLLFTSGSEAFPKGVILSHENSQANRYQLNTKFDFHKNDIALIALPLFHSFGFMGLTMQLFTGTFTLCYPTPLHYRVIPELSYDINATIIYGTDTFLKGYGQRANPYDFYSIRYVLSGGEALKKETRELWFEKFGIRIIEGYGITETAPVIACNTPTHFKSGTVGRFLPTVEYKLEKIPEIQEENTGRLWVKGPNILKGYLAMNKTSEIIPPKDNWYDTGDIVNIDEFGFVTLRGRVKRFAKLAGEMISLNVVENYLSEIRNDVAHAVISVPDDRKGEALVVITECHLLSRELITEHFKARNISMLMLPKKIIFVKKLPRTAAGKINYLSLRDLLEEE